MHSESLEKSVCCVHDSACCHACQAHSMQTALGRYVLLLTCQVAAVAWVWIACQATHQAGPDNGNRHASLVVGRHQLLSQVLAHGVGVRERPHVHVHLGLYSRAADKGQRWAAVSIATHRCHLAMVLSLQKTVCVACSTDRGTYIDPVLNKIWANFTVHHSQHSHDGQQLSPCKPPLLLNRVLPLPQQCVLPYCALTHPHIGFCWLHTHQVRHHVLVVRQLFANLKRVQHLVNGCTPAGSSSTAQYSRPPQQLSVCTHNGSSQDAMASSGACEVAR